MCVDLSVISNTVGWQLRLKLFIFACSVLSAKHSMIIHVTCIQLNSLYNSNENVL